MLIFSPSIYLPIFDQNVDTRMFSAQLEHVYKFEISSGFGSECNDGSIKLCKCCELASFRSFKGLAHTNHSHFGSRCYLNITCDLRS